MAAVRRVLLVDASPYVFRAHFALPSSLVDVEGRPAHAVYGFASFLLKLIADESPTHLGVAFDRSLTQSFRNQLCADYKRQREPPPDDLVAQLDDCRAIAEALGAATWVDETFEADDLLATVCERVAPTPITLVTSDKDLAQLVDHRVEWLDYARGRRLGERDVEARMGVPPRQIPDLLGLAGDPVDNIPGVRGLGPKSAALLLANFGSLEAMLASLPEVAALPVRGAARMARLLAEQEDAARLSKRLATVVRDVPLTTSLDALELRAPQRDRIESLAERLGFEGLRERLLQRR